ncbi:hypothetical protein SpCBS45565_g04167 [Spizellomyces sp. 'palustris']|nr:hypothetical protein SpCBS45565_g04167 [Spizellomyces sp. 'palustris']
MSNPGTPFRSLGRPRAKAEYEDAIERTPEYEQFMKQLEDFNRAQGVSLQREPVLGGKRLDLYRIYRWVVEAGGYEQVTAARGWKKVTDPFNLPATCTNAAYVVKNLYQKYLYNWEQVHMFGKPINVIMQQKRPFDQISNVGEESTPGSPEGRRRRMQSVGLSTPTPVTPPVARVRSFAPDEPLHKRLRLMAEANLNAAAVVSHQPLQPLQPPTPLPMMISKPVHVPVPAPTPAPAPHPVSASSLVLVNPDDNGQDEKYLYGAWKNRLTLALTSTLPNEVDWAFTKLVKLSYTKNFYVGIIPGMFEAILDHAAPLFDELVIKKSGGVIETHTVDNPKAIPPISSVSMFYDEGISTLLERVLQVLHVLRNLSFWPDNAMHFGKSYALLTYLAKGIALPTSSYYVQIKHHSLDLLDNLTPYLTLQGPNDFYLACLHQNLFDNDRAVIISCTRTLTRFCSTEANAKILKQVDTTAVVQRFLQLLLVPDEELVNAVLDWFYEYSSLGSDAALRISEAAPFNVLKLFIKFLSWQGFTHKRPVPGVGVGPPQSGMVLSSVPASSAGPVGLSKAAGSANGLIKEPNGTSLNANQQGNVIAVNGVSSSDGGILSLGGATARSADWPASVSAAVASSAPAHSLTMSGMPYPVPGSVPGTFPAHPQMGTLGAYAPTTGPLAPSIAGKQEPQVTTQSVLSQPAASNPSVPALRCWWGASHSSPGCHVTVQHLQDLFDHLQKEHLVPGQQTYTCEWKGCTWRGDGDQICKSRPRALKHVVTHLGSNTASQPPTESLPGGHQPSLPSGQPPSSAEDDLNGIPLTAMLVLRNLARVPEHKALFAPFEGGLAQKMVSDRRFAKGLAGVLGELAKGA